MAKKPRGEKLPPFVPLLHQTLDCPAWHALGPYARLLYVSLKRRTRPHTNGDVFLSVRDAGKEIGAHRNTAMAAFRELQAKGFVRASVLGHLGVEGEGKATTWILTEMGTTGGRPTKDFLEWREGQDFTVQIAAKPNRPQMQKPVTIDVHPCHSICDVSGAPVTASVPPWHSSCDVSGEKPAEPVTKDVPHIEYAKEGALSRPQRRARR